MQLDGEAASRLRALSDLTGEQDLAVAVMDLVRSVLVAVPSCVAFQVVVRGADPVTVSVPVAAPAAASLRIELCSRAPGPPHRVVLLAAESGAFADFDGVLASGDRAGRDRAGGAWAGGARDGRDGGRPAVPRLVIDGDLPGTATAGDGSAAQDDDGTRVVDRAVGFLLGRGLGPEAAVAELEGRSRVSGRSLAEEAGAVLRRRG